MDAMVRFAVLMSGALVACTPSESRPAPQTQPPTDAGSDDGPDGDGAPPGLTFAPIRVNEDAIVAGDAAIPGCSDLTTTEQRALERCAESRWLQPEFTTSIARIDLRTVPMRIRINFSDDRFHPALPGDACDRTAKVLANRAGCAWDVEESSSLQWTIIVVDQDVK